MYGYLFDKTPSYLRGLDFVGDFAVVGLSEPRGEKAFAGLALQARIEAKKAKARCAIQVIDLRTGDVVHWVRFESLLHEFYDVAVLRGCARPMAIGFQTDEIRRAITIGGPRAVRFRFWHRKTERPDQGRLRRAGFYAVGSASALAIFVLIRPG